MNILERVFAVLTASFLSLLTLPSGSRFAHINVGLRSLPSAYLEVRASPAPFVRDYATTTERIFRLTRNLRLTEQVTWTPKVDIGNGVRLGVGLSGLLE